MRCTRISCPTRNISIKRKLKQASVASSRVYLSVQRKNARITVSTASQVELLKEAEMIIRWPLIKSDYDEAKLWALPQTSINRYGMKIVNAKVLCTQSPDCRHLFAQQLEKLFMFRESYDNVLFQNARMQDTKGNIKVPASVVSNCIEDCVVT